MKYWTIFLRLLMNKNSLVIHIDYHAKKKKKKKRGTYLDQKGNHSLSYVKGLSSPTSSILKVGLQKKHSHEKFKLGM